MTVLELVQAAAYQSNMTFIPSALYSATDNASKQLLHLFYETGRDLLPAAKWPQLKRTHRVFLESGRSEYPLPQDFYSSLPETHWEVTNSWQSLGPLGDSEWNLRLYGYATAGTRKAFRIFGPDINQNSGGGQFQVDPVPGDGEAGEELTFEYISKSWLRPASWSASTAYTSGAYANSAGNIYSAGSSATSGSTPPNMAYGVGRDGGVKWKALSASGWASTTYYAAGTYATNGGNLYLCVTGGYSAGSGGPSGTDEETEVTDNTATWIYIAAPSWTGQTDFARGAHSKAGSQYYKCLQSGKTGSVQPTWTATTVSDGTITWTFQSAAYETIRADTDLCLFDDQLMIAGLKWQFLRARGLEYQDIRADYERSKAKAAGRFNTGQTFNLAGTIRSTLPNVPEGNFEF